MTRSICWRCCRCWYCRQLVRCQFERKSNANDSIRLHRTSSSTWYASEWDRDWLRKRTASHDACKRQYLTKKYSMNLSSKRSLFIWLKRRRNALMSTSITSKHCNSWTCKLYTVECYIEPSHRPFSFLLRQRRRSEGQGVIQYSLWVLSLHLFRCSNRYVNSFIHCAQFNRCGREVHGRALLSTARLQFNIEWAVENPTRDASARTYT